jgi:hypothetical protein
LASKLLCPSLAVGSRFRFPRFHDAGRYVLSRNEATRNHSFDPPHIEFFPKILLSEFIGSSWGGRRRLTGPIATFGMREEEGIDPGRHSSGRSRDPQEAVNGYL